MNDPPNLPSVSIVLPVRNEEKYVENCLECLVEQDYANIREILVFDGMSNDATRRKIAKFQEFHPKIRVFDNPGKIQMVALNKGIEVAKGEVIVRIDAHALYGTDYVTQCITHLMKTGAANVGGPQVPRPRTFSWQARAIVFAHQSRFGIGVGKHRQASVEGYTDTVWLGAFWKSVFQEVGPFREELTRSEDIDWNRRLRQHGYKIFITPKIRATYFPRERLWGLWQQNFGNGVGISQTLFVNWRAVRLRHLVPLLFLIAITGSVMGAIFNSLGVFILAGILGSYLVLCLLFSARIALKNGVKYLPIMPVVFGTIHFSYGLGSLWGLLKYGLIKRGKS